MIVSHVRTSFKLIGHRIAHKCVIANSVYSKSLWLLLVNNCKSGTSGSWRFTMSALAVLAWCLCRNIYCLTYYIPELWVFHSFKLWHYNRYCTARLSSTFGRWRARLACKLRTWHHCEFQVLSPCTYWCEHLTRLHLKAWFKPRTHNPLVVKNPSLVYYGHPFSALDCSWIIIITVRFVWWYFLYIILCAKSFMSNTICCLFPLYYGVPTWS